MSDEIIELENVVDTYGMRRLHLISNGEINASQLQKYDLPFGTEIEQSKEVGVYHARASWPICGPLVINCEGWPVPKMFVVWSYEHSESVSVAIHNAALQYAKLFGQRPEFAYVSKLPRGVENGKEVEDLMLFQAEWMVSKCVAVGWLYQ
jgi:hypothetical protein